MGQVAGLQASARKDQVEGAGPGGREIRQGVRRGVEARAGRRTVRVQQGQGPGGQGLLGGAGQVRSLRAERQNDAGPEGAPSDSRSSPAP